MPYINGFSVSSSPSRIGVKTYRVPGTEVYLPVRSEIAPLLIGAATEWHRTVEPLRKGWCWGYAYREVTGGNSYSFHAAGIAIDLNAPMHGYGRRGTMGPGDADRVRRIARKYGLRWGGDYRRTADEMHLEVILNRSDALALVRRIQAQPAPGAIDPTPGTGHEHHCPTLKIGSTGEAVYDLQGHIRAWRRNRNLSLPARDSQYGRGTAEAVATFQRAYGLPADGEVGPRTWNKIHYISKGARI